MENNYGPFLWRVDRKFGTQKAFCEAAGIAPNTLVNYINGTTPMPSTFIMKACELLDIKTEEIGFYFFKPDED